MQHWRSVPYIAQADSITTTILCSALPMLGHIMHNACICGVYTNRDRQEMSHYNGQWQRTTLEWCCAVLRIQCSCNQKPSTTRILMQNTKHFLILIMHQGLEQICVPFSSYRYTFSMFIEGLWQGKICTHADDGGCCARLMYVSLGKWVEIREMSPKHVHYAVKQA